MTKAVSHQFSPNAVLLVCLILMVFLTPIINVSYHSLAYGFLFSCIFILSVLSLQHRRKKVLFSVALLLVIVTWIAFKVDFPGLFVVSRIAQGFFFLFIVVQLIRQTASAKNVNVRVIADSINGYLLVGVIYSIIVYSIVRFDPGAFHFPEVTNESELGLENELALMSKMFYFTFVTYTSTGYGDVTPVVPAARSVATLISATGQLYIAIIIAMLVGKFSSATTGS